MTGTGARVGAGAEVAAHRSRRLASVLLANLGLVGLEVGLGLIARSSALVADAGHNLTDVAGVGLSLVALRLALRPRTARRSFGNHRATILAALANAVFVVVVAVGVAGVALWRLSAPTRVAAGMVLGVAAASIAVNAACAWVLRHDRSNLGMRAVLLHLATDVFAALLVLLDGLVLALSPRWHLADPAAALAIAVVVVAQAVGIVRRSVAVLLEAAPPTIDVARLSAAIAAVPGVEEVHDLHVWSLSDELHALSAHLVLEGHPTLEEAQALGERVKAAVRGPFDIAHATLELECERCVEEPVDPCGIDDAAAGPDRLPAAVRVGDEAIATSQGEAPPSGSDALADSPGRPTVAPLAADGSPSVGVRPR
jgi:cobalt-zinc-cadmium efflux system protein